MCLPQQQVDADGGSSAVFDTQVVVALENGDSPQVVLSQPTTEPQPVEQTHVSDPVVDERLSFSTTNFFFTYIVVRDILFGFGTIFGGLILGKMIVINVDKAFGSTLSDNMYKQDSRIAIRETVTPLSMNQSDEYIPTISINNIPEEDKNWTNYNNDSENMISPLNLTVNGNMSTSTNNVSYVIKWIPAWTRHSRDPTIQIFKEVAVGAIVMMLLLRFLEVPMTRTIFTREYKLGQRGLLALFWIKLFLLELCCIALIIIFDKRFCNPNFDADLMRGPVGVMAYLLSDISITFRQLFMSRFTQYMNYEGGFEVILTLPLTLAISFPMYTLLKYYWTHVEEYQASIQPVYYFFDLCRLELEKSKTVLYAALLEFVEFEIVLWGVTALIRIIPNWTVWVSSCLVMTPLSLILSYLMIFVESRCPKLSDYTRTNYWYRISLNLLLLLYQFVPNIFLLYFWDVRHVEFACESGMMTVKNDVSRALLYYTTISAYMGWKIVFLCVYSNSKRSEDYFEAGKTDTEIAGEGAGKVTGECDTVLDV